MQVTSIVSVFFIVVSILSFCLKTHPTMRVPVIRNISVHVPLHPHSNRTASTPPRSAGQRRSLEARSAGHLLWILDKQRTQPHDAFFYIECVRLPVLPSSTTP